MTTIKNQMKVQFEKRPWAALGLAFGVGASLGALNLLPIVASLALREVRRAAVTSIAHRGARMLAGS